MRSLNSIALKCPQDLFPLHPFPSVLQFASRLRLTTAIFPPPSNPSPSDVLPLQISKSLRCSTSSPQTDSVAASKRRNVLWRSGPYGQFFAWRCGCGPNFLLPSPLLRGPHTGSCELHCPFRRNLVRGSKTCPLLAATLMRLLLLRSRDF